MSNKRLVWKIWEELAIPYLEKYGYKIIDRNATFLGGELDIIGYQNNLWRCVEVKYRANDLFGYPEDAMTPKKIKNLMYAIQLYCIKNHINIDDFRLDFLGILKLPDGNLEYRLIQDIV